MMSQRRLLPHNLSDYDELRYLGKGGFGTVRAMQCKQDGVVYAIKTVNLNLITQKADNHDVATKIKKYIFDEAAMLQRIGHPNVVHVYASFLENDSSGAACFHIVMELCQYHFKKLIYSRKDGFHDEAIVIGWAVQLLAALRCLHEKWHILHRDIKSENILVHGDSRMLKLGDFGLAKSAASTSLLSAHSNVGTCTHMPPEVVSGGEFQWVSDSWSLGVVLFEACAKNLPFPYLGNNIATTLTVVTSPIPPIPEAYSAELRQLFAEGILVRDPTKRLKIGQICEHPVFRIAYQQWEASIADSIAVREVPANQPEPTAALLALQSLQQQNEQQRQEAVRPSPPINLFAAVDTGDVVQNFEEPSYQSILSNFKLISQTDENIMGLIPLDQTTMFSVSVEGTVQKFVNDKTVAQANIYGAVGMIDRTCWDESSGTLYLSSWGVDGKPAGLYGIREFAAAFDIKNTPTADQLYTPKKSWGLTFDPQRHLLLVCCYEDGIKVLQVYEDGAVELPCHLQLEAPLEPQYCAVVPGQQCLTLAVTSANPPMLSFHIADHDGCSFQSGTTIKATMARDITIAKGQSGFSRFSPQCLEFVADGRLLLVADKDCQCVRIFRLEIRPDYRNCQQLWHSSNLNFPLDLFCLSRTNSEASNGRKLVLASSGSIFTAELNIANFV